MADIDPLKTAEGLKKQVAGQKAATAAVGETIDKKRQELAIQALLNRSYERTTEAILRGNSARSKGEKYLTAIRHAVSNLEQREDKYLEAIIKQERLHEKNLKTHKEMEKTYKDTVGLQRQYNELQEENKKSLEKIDKHYKNDLKALEKMLSVQEEFTKSNIFFIRNEKEYNSALEERLKAQEKILAVLKEQGEEQGGISDIAYKRGMEEVRSEENVAKVRSSLRDKAAGDEAKREAYRAKLKEFVSPYKKDKDGNYLDKEGKYVTPEKHKIAIRSDMEATKFAKKERFELTKELGGRVKGLMSAKGIGGHLEAAKGIGETIGKLKDLTSILGGVGKGAAGAAGMFGMLGTAMEMLGKIGWIGLLLAAVTMVAKAINASDKLIKGLNQTFVKMYGPTVLLKDVNKSMSEFSNSIFDMSRNLKYGVDSKEIIGMFEAMSAGGMSLQGVGQNIKGGYNEAILSAIKLSKDFGVDLSTMGGMITGQMIDLKSSIEDVSKSFGEMSYDASIAGIQSQKFYDAILSATDALSFYGNYLSSTSAMLKAFTKAGATNFKDASKEVQELTGLFGGMSSAQQRMFTQWAGVDKIQKLERDRAAELEKQVKEDTTLTEDQKNTKLSQAASLRRYAGPEGSPADVMKLFQGLTSLSDKTLSIIQEKLNDMHIDLLDPKNTTQITQMLQTFSGISDKTVSNISTQLNEAIRQAGVINKEITTGLKDAGDKTVNDVDKLLNVYAQAAKSGKKINMTDLENDLKSITDLAGNTRNDIIKAAKSNLYAAAEAAHAVNKPGDVPGSRGYTASDVILSPVQTAAEGAGDDARQTTLAELSTSFEKLIGITKENVAYLAAKGISDWTQHDVNSAIVGTAESAKGILDFLKHPDAKTGEERDKDPVWKESITLQKRLYLLQIKQDKAQKKYNDAILHGTKDQIKKATDDADATRKEIDNTKEALAATIDEGNYGANKDEIENLGIIQGQAEVEARAKEPPKGKAEEDKGFYGGSGIFVLPSSHPQDFSKTEDSNSQATNTAYPRSALGTSAIGGTPADTDKTEIAEIKDGMVLTSGLLKATAGDIFANNTKGAKVISAGMGQFTNKLLSDTGAATPGAAITVQVNMGDLHEIHDVDGFVKRIGPAMEQLVRRIGFQENTRK